MSQPWKRYDTAEGSKGHFWTPPGPRAFRCTAVNYLRIQDNVDILTASDNPYIKRVWPKTPQDQLD